MDGMGRFPKAPAAGTRLGGSPAIPSGTGYPWVDGDILYAADLNAAFDALSGAGPFLEIAGGTLTGPLLLAANPTQGAGAATKTYVDTAVSGVTGAATALNNVGRNLIHNPMFNVAQRAAGPWTTVTYTADRWSQNLSLDTVSTVIPALPDAFRTAIGDEAAENALQTTVTGNAGAAAYTVISQPIEDVRRLSGKTVTVSFWAWSAAGTPKLGVSVDQQFGSGGAPSAPVSGAGQAVTINTTPARYSLTFALPSSAGKTFGTTANTNFTLLNFWLSSGANQATRAGNIGVQSATFAIWGVQLEIGSVATPLEKPDPRYDLSNCQRFFSVGNMQLNAYNVAGGACGYSAPFAVHMRAVPIVTPTGTGGANYTAFNFVAQSATSWLLTFIAVATGAASWAGTFTASSDL